MNVTNVLRKAAKLAYKSKAFDLLAYVKSAHMNYVAFALTIINLVVILNGVVLPYLRVPAPLRLATTALILLAVGATSLILGWIDVNAGGTRKTVEKQAYWRRPTWAQAATLTLRVADLPSVVSLWLRLKGEGTADEELKRCFRNAVHNTVEWVYFSHLEVGKPPMSQDVRCLERLASMLGLDVSDIKDEILEILKKPEFR